MNYQTRSSVVRLRCIESLGLDCLNRLTSNAWLMNRPRIPFKLQVELPIEYKHIKLDCGYRIDLLADERLIVELKSVDQLLRIHEAQVLTYMKLADVRVGLLINFNVDVLKKGIRRFVL